MKKLIMRISAFALIIFTFGGVFLANKSGFDNPNLSLEFQGGYEMLVQVKNDVDISEEQLTTVAASISKRIDILGVKNPQIDVEPELKAIRVTLAGLNEKEEQEEAETLVSRQGKVEFRNTEGALLMSGDVVQNGGASLTYNQQGQPIVALSIADKEKFASVTKDLSTQQAPANLLVTWIDFNEAKAIFNKVEGRFPSDSEMYSYSVRGLGQHGDYITPKMKPFLISYASVNEELKGDATISGNFTEEEARNLADLINSGSFNYELELIESNNVPATYGGAAFDRSIQAGMIGFAAISGFMIIIYGLFGIISSITLLIYLMITLVVFNSMGGEYGPDTIAALVIGLGMAVDANIITFERIKDEVYKGRNLVHSINMGLKKTLSTILDSNITTFIAGFLLFWFGTRTIRGFSIMLILSIFFTLVITVIVTRIIINIVAKTKFFDKNKFALKGRLFGLEKSKISEVAEGEMAPDRIFKGRDLLSASKYFSVLSMLVILAGAIFALLGSMNPGIEFTGGTRITLTSQKDETISETQFDEVSNKLTEIGEGFDIKRSFIARPEDGEGDITFVYIISSDYESNIDVKDKYIQVLADYKLEEASKSSISPQVANQLVNNALMATAIASFFIILYVSLRFKWTYAIAAIVALLHDVLIVSAVFVIFKIEINLSFISAILAIIGYSINDTIVTFDRTREIVKDVANESEKELKWAINKALKQTVTRSFFTTVTTLLAIISLLVFGTNASFNFNIALLVGLITGTYSSVFIASKVWLFLEKSSLKKKKLKKPRVTPLPGIQEQIFAGIND